MEVIELIRKTAEHAKVFIWGFGAGAVIQYFEIDVGNKSFNPGKFIVSSCVMGILTQISFFVINGEIINIENRNDEKDIVLSITLATFLYLFIPFVLRPENRGRFVENVLARFGFFKKDK